jgi:hypothetical protein
MGCPGEVSDATRPTNRRAHVDPASTLSFISGGNPRFPAGLTSWQAVGQWRSADGTLTRGQILVFVIRSFFL